jgi:hypothetical protein
MLKRSGASGEKPTDVRLASTLICVGTATRASGMRSSGSMSALASTSVVVVSELVMAWPA